MMPHHKLEVFLSRAQFQFFFGGVFRRIPTRTCAPARPLWPTTVSSTTSSPPPRRPSPPPSRSPAWPTRTTSQVLDSVQTSPWSFGSDSAAEFTLQCFGAATKPVYSQGVTSYTQSQQTRQVTVIKPAAPSPASSTFSIYPVTSTVQPVAAAAAAAAASAVPSYSQSPTYSTNAVTYSGRRSFLSHWTGLGRLGVDIQPLCNNTIITE